MKNKLLNRNKLLQLFYCFSFMLLFANTVVGQTTYTWIKTTGTWETVGNWSTTSATTASTPTTSGSTTVILPAANTNAVLNAGISGTGIPVGSTITAVSGLTLTISSAATATGSVSVVCRAPAATVPGNLAGDIANITNGGQVTLSSNTTIAKTTLGNNTGSVNGSRLTISGSTTTLTVTSSNDADLVVLTGGNLVNNGILNISSTFVGATFGIRCGNVPLIPGSLVTYGYSGTGTLSINTSACGATSGGLLFNGTSNSLFARYSMTLTSGTNTAFTLAANRPALQFNGGSTTTNALPVIIAGSGFTMGTLPTPVTGSLLSLSNGANVTVNSGVILTLNSAAANTANGLDISNSTSVTGLTTVFNNNGNINILGKTAASGIKVSTFTFSGTPNIFITFVNTGLINVDIASVGATSTDFSPAAFTVSNGFGVTNANAIATITNNGTFTLKNSATATGNGQAIWVTGAGQRTKVNFTNAATKTFNIEGTVGNAGAGFTLENNGIINSNSSFGSFVALNNNSGASLNFTKSPANFTVDAAAAATAGDVYRDASLNVYTISTTKVTADGTQLLASVDPISAIPATGTLTRFSGTGDATIAYTVVATIASATTSPTTNIGTINTGAASRLGVISGVTAASTGVIDPGGTTRRGIANFSNAAASLAINSTLSLQIAGSVTAGADYDQITNSTSGGGFNIGAATLNVTSIYTPSVLTSIDILTTNAGAITGTFGTINPALPSGWAVNYGVAGKVQLVYAPAPTITQLADGIITQGCGGSTLTITGTGFTGASAVTVNTVAVASFVVDSSTQITAVLPAGPITAGAVAVTTAGGTETFGSFAVNANVTPTFTQVAAICSGGSLTALLLTSDNGIAGTWSPALDNTATTLYTFTPTAGQCATTATMTITVTPKPTTVVTNATICSGATYTWLADGQPYTTTQTALTITNDGCTADQVLNLTVTPKPETVVTNATICSGATYAWAANGLPYTTTQTALTISNDGCTADQVLNLTVTPKPADDVTNATICSGATYTWGVNSVGYTTSQTVTITNDGCTANQVLNLTVTPKPADDVTNATICSGATYTWGVNSVGYTTSQTVTITNDGCTANQVLNLTVTPKPADDVTNATICSGATYTWSANSSPYTTTQTALTITNDGCTANQVLNLTVTPKPATVVTNATICSGATYTWSANSLPYMTAQTALTISNDGCTADQVLNLTVTPKPAAVVTNATICSGASYTWTTNGSSYNTTQSALTITNDGCTADQVLNLTVTPKPADDVTNATICSGATYTWGVNSVGYTTSQTVTVTNDGCTANQVLNLIVTPKPADDVTNATICSGATYTWGVNSVGYTTSQTVTISNDGCTANQVLNLIVTPKPANNVTNATICSGVSYTWTANGSSYNTTQTALTITNDGCTANQVLNLTVTPKPATVVTNATICSGATYTWSANSLPYTTAQTALTITNDGCTADQVLNLTITPATTTGSVTQTQTGGSYLWAADGQTYSASGIYTYVTGCNTATLNLTINSGDPGNEDNNGGLESLDPPTITQLTSDGTNVITQGCGGSTIVIVGTNFLGTTAVTVNGVAVTSFVITNSATLTVVLPAGPTTGQVSVTTPKGTALSAGSFTVNAATSSSVSITACDTYTWAANGTTYTASGTYTNVTTNAAGCPDTATLVLTITPSTTNNSVTQTQTGGTYLWATPLGNGQTYTASGIYTYVDGCNTATLNLTINTATIWYSTGWTNGAPTASIEAIIEADYNTTTNGAISAKKLTVNTGVLTVKSGTNLTVVNELINNSGPTAVVLENNANLIQTGSATNTGAITVKRNSSLLRLLDYTLWSSPVASQNLLAFSPATVLSRFYTYNTTTNLYNAVPSPATTDFGLGKGYLIRMPNTASPSVDTAYPGVFTGVPNNGTVPFTMTVGAPGFNFNAVGNPYPSPISMSTFVANNSTKITGTLYFWRKRNGIPGGAYCTWNNGTFITNGNAQSFDPLGIIQTGQGFIVEASSAATGLTFNNGQRVANNAGQFFKTKQVVENNRIWLNAITAATGEFAQMAINYATGAVQGVDAFDAKYFNDGAIALNSVLDNADYVIQGRALPFDGTDEVSLSFKAATAGSYSIAIDHVDGLFAANQDIILKDNVTGAETNLKAGAYAFAAEAGASNSRFVLKYQKTLGTITSEFTEDSVIIDSNKGIIHINSGGITMKNVQLFDMNGRLVFKKDNVNKSEMTIDGSRFAHQVLIVKITSDDMKEVSKKVVN